VEVDVVPFLEMFLRDNASGTALGHVGRVGGPNVDLTSVSIMVGKVKLNEPVPSNVDVDAFDVDGVVKLCVVACADSKTVGL
jgi:hypothetical protein